MDQPVSQIAGKLPYWLNIAGLYGICATLLVAFYYQLFRQELPCPLCLLQRVGMVLIGFGFLFNVRFGIRNIHYGVALIGAVVSGALGMRQVFLHILPGDPGYGSPFLGAHFYSWTVVTSIATIVAISVMMMLKSDSDGERPGFPMPARIAAGLFTVLIAANLLSTVLECGGGQCDDNPTSYQLLR